MTDRWVIFVCLAPPLPPSSPLNEGLAVVEHAARQSGFKCVCARGADEATALISWILTPIDDKTNNFSPPSTIKRIIAGVVILARDMSTAVHPSDQFWNILLHQQQQPEPTPFVVTIGKACGDLQLRLRAFQNG